MKQYTETEIFALSSQQSLILKAEELLKRPLTAHVLTAFSGVIDRDRLVWALKKLCKRHEVLRTTYKRIPEMNLPVQEIHADPRYSLIEDSGNAKAGVQQAAADALHQAPVVVTLFDQEVLVSVFLASADKNSLKAIGNELRNIYSGKEAEAFDGLQYADYAAWQEDLKATDLGVQGADFWRSLYEAADGSSQLPFECLSEPNYEAHSCEKKEQINFASIGVGRSLGLSKADIWLFLWGAFVSRLGLGGKFLVFTDTDRRNDLLVETLGRFVSPLPVVFDLQQERPLNENVKLFALQLDVSRSWSECFDEWDLVGSDLCKKKAVHFGFSYEEADDGDISVYLDEAPFSKLHLKIIEGEDNEILIRLYYQSSLFSQNTVTEWLGQFVHFVQGTFGSFDKAVDQISLINPCKKFDLYRDLDRTLEYETDTNQFLHHIFEHTTDKSPENIAVCVGSRTITYADLDRKANKLAHALRNIGVSEEQVVAVYGERSIEMIVALIGILKAGGAYLPLDPAYPGERLTFMLEDAGALCVVALQPIKGDLVLDSSVTVVDLDLQNLSRYPDTRLPTGPGTAEQLAYVIYTSGSTGRPKGVMVSHSNVCASTLARFEFYSKPVERFLMLSSFSFDSSVAGIFWTLGQGGELHLPVEESYQDPRDISDIIADQEITHILTLPSFYSQILEHLTTTDLTCAIVAGESCSVELIKKHGARQPQADLVNEYGPSEGTVWSSGYIVPPEFSGARTPIGTSISGTQLLVVDMGFEPVAEGQEGELCVGGHGLTRGYLSRPALTAERFVPNPFFPGERLYRTGDQVRRYPQGPLEFLGRMDAQVKVRGHRIELGEIAARLGQHEMVSDAAVMVGDVPEGGQIIGYVAPHDKKDSELQEQVLLDFMREKLPPFMLPSRICFIESIPRLPNGKVDYTSLSKIPLTARSYLAPRTDLEITLANIWQDILQVERVGVYDRFFELGGHSLLATRVRYQIQRDLNVMVPIKVLLDCETIESLSMWIERNCGCGVHGDNIDALEALFDSVGEK